MRILKCCNGTKPFVTRTFPLGDTNYSVELCKAHAKLSNPTGEKFA